MKIVLKLLLLLLPACLFSQNNIQGIVLDSVSGKPVPYANLWIENGTTGTTSSANGQFTLAAKASNRIVCSAVGFGTKTILAANAQKIVLAQIMFGLDEVILQKPFWKKEREIGESQKKWHVQLCGESPWIDAKRFAYQLEYQQTPYIKTAVVFTDSHTKNATFRLRLYEIGADGMPGNDLLKEPIIVAVKKGMNKNKIDLRTFDLQMPENGIIVGYEWLILESNKYHFEYKEKDALKSFVTYDPTVVLNPVETENTYHYRGGRWIFQEKMVYQGKFSNKVMEPAINLILSN